MAKAPYLGFMLDVSRHFMSVEDVLKLLDAAAVCGVNTMHWHLTDDQGWRIEIKKYPRLTQVGSVRGDSFFGAVSETEHTSFLFYHFVKDLSIPFRKTCFGNHIFVSYAQTTPPNFYISSCKNIKNRLAIIAKV